jgi:glycine/D-amino acid oxidase-like deaminating enzyme
LGGSASFTFGLVRAHGIACDAVQNGWVQPAHHETRVELAKARVRQWASRGFDVRLLSRDEMASRLGSDHHHGGWIAATGGHLNPLALTRGLARVAIAAGARVFGLSPATSLRQDGARWRISTPGGAVDAGKVVLATAAYNGGLWPGLARTIVPVVNWQLSTSPLPPHVRRRVLPGDVAMSDTRGDLRFARLDAHGRLVSGASPILPLRAEARLRALVAARLLDFFPALRELPALEFDHVWNGAIAMTRDGVPHFHELAPGVFTALGCNGRGLGLSVALGKAMAEATLGTPAASLDVPLTRPRSIPLQAFVRRVAPGVLAWLRYRDSRP